jgi:hypothetical protein
VALVDRARHRLQLIDNPRCARTLKGTRRPSGSSLQTARCSNGRDFARQRHQESADCKNQTISIASPRAATSSVPSHQADLRPAHCRKMHLTSRCCGDGSRGKNLVRSRCQLDRAAGSGIVRPERPGSLEIDDQFLENSSDVKTDQTIVFRSQNAGHAVMTTRPNRKK